MGMLVGRESELRHIEGLLAAAREGQGAALVIQGDPGIGKSALLQYARERATGMRCLTTRGVESESEIPFSGLSELLRPVLRLLPALPPPQVAALGGALALSPPRTDDRFAIFAASFNLLVAASEESPLLVIVDDTHWLDVSSAEAILFAARRLGADGIVMLMARRTGEPMGLSLAGISTLEIEGLNRQAAAILSSAGPRTISPPVVDRLFEVTKGNPLALLEIPALLSDGQLAGQEPIDTPLPAGGSIEKAFLRQVSGLPLPCRQLLLVAAASDTADTDVIWRPPRSWDWTPAPSNQPKLLVWLPFRQARLSGATLCCGRPSTTEPPPPSVGQRIGPWARHFAARNPTIGAHGTSRRQPWALMRGSPQRSRRRRWMPAAATPSPQPGRRSNGQRGSVHCGRTARDVASKPPEIHNFRAT